MYRYYRLQIIRLQSFGRMINQRRKYDEIIISTIISQTVIRGFIERRKYLRNRQRIIRLQSWYRMIRVKQSYQWIREQIIKIQSQARRYIAFFNYQIALVSILAIQAMVRRGIHRNRFMLSKVSAIMIQSHYRKFIEMKRLSTAKNAQILIGKVFRGYYYQQLFQLKKLSSNRIKRAVHRFLLNLHLFQRIHSFHELAASNHFAQSSKNDTPLEDSGKVGGVISRYSVSKQQVSTTAGNQILQHLNKFPLDRYIRYYYDHSLKSFLHSLLRSADDELIKVLHFTPKECFEADIHGRTSLHYLAKSKPNMNILRLLSDCINHVRIQSNVIAIDGFDEDNDNDDDGDGPGGDGKMHQIKQALHKSVGTSSLKSGWLKKKRGGMMWQKRWMVLTEDYIIYYKNPQTINNPKFAIPLQGCTIQRLPGSKDPIFELIAPNMGEKKSIFGSSTKKSMNFLCESEKDLQEWLLPLKAVAGVGTFRTTPVHYVNTDLRKLWVTMEDIENEIALHSLMKSPLLMSSSGKKSSASAPDDHFIEDIIAVVAWLIEFGSNINHQNIRGETPLFVAISNLIDPRIVRCLLVKGADTKLPNSRGVSPLDLINQQEDRRKLYHEMLHSLGGSKGKPMAPQVMNNPINAVIERNYFSNGKLKGYSQLSLFFGMQTFNKV
jgi:hypothetical protein